MKDLIKFNVFGMLMSVERKDNTWLLYRKSETGLKSKVTDILIPADLAESEISGYLDDIYHEQANENYPTVMKLD